jgi:Leucine-rich repeat (LRR) protein
MAFAKCLAFFLWTFGAFLNEGNCTTYKGYNQGHTAVPGNIPSDATEILLFYNKIKSILQTDFNDKFPELYKINLVGNEVARIERGCFRGTVLRLLYLGENQLTEFPDFSQVANTIESIGLSKNRMSLVRADDVKNLILLESLLLYDNPLVFITELFLHLPSITLLDLQNTPLPCCNSTAWLKDLGSPAETSGVTCSPGTSLVGENLDSITKEQLMGDLCRE